MTLFDIRDNAFHLLVQKLGEQTPLIYASRTLFSLKGSASVSSPFINVSLFVCPGLGKNHRDIPILVSRSTLTYQPCEILPPLFFLSDNGGTLSLR